MRERRRTTIGDWVNLLAVVFLGVIALILVLGPAVPQSNQASLGLIVVAFAAIITPKDRSSAAPQRTTTTATADPASVETIDRDTERSCRPG